MKRGSANGGLGIHDTCPPAHLVRRGAGEHCPDVRDLLINNGLPLKFNRTSISGGRRDDVGKGGREVMRGGRVHRVAREKLFCGVAAITEIVIDEGSVAAAAGRWRVRATVGGVGVERRKNCKTPAKLLRRASAAKRHCPAAQLLYGSRISGSLYM